MTDPDDLHPRVEKLDGLGWAVIVMTAAMLGWLIAHRLGWL